MASKRILIHYLGTKGGGALYNYNLTKGFAQADFEVVSIVGASNETLEMHKQLNADLHVLPVFRQSIIKPLLRMVPFFVQALRVYWENRETIVLITMTSPLDILLLPMWSLMKTKLAFVAHDVRTRDGAPKFGPWLSRLIARRAKWIIALSKEAEKDCIESKCVHKHNQIIRSIHGAFHYEKSDEATDDGMLKILVFGRLEYYRGIDIALEAYKKLEESGYQVRLEIWGSGDISAYKQIIDNCSRIQIVNRWIAEDEVSMVFKGCGILLAPYRHASQSGVVPLAISMGYPVIASSVGGLKEQVANNVNGILLGEPIWPDMIVSCIADLLSDRRRLSTLYETTQKCGDELKNWQKISTDLWSKLQ